MGFLSSSKDLTDKVVVVTGGAGLIGTEFVKSIASENGIAIIADLNKKVGRELEKKLASTYKNIFFYQLDVTSKGSIESLVESINQKFGRIDALVNNAYPRNSKYGRELFDVSYEDFCKNLGMNLGGLFLTSQVFFKYFQKQGFGNTINIGSIYGEIAPKFEIYKNTEMTMPVEYAAIKSGVVHMTKYMAKYLKGKNIRINSISPGGIYNGQAEEFCDAYNSNCLNKGMLDAQDVTGTLVYLLSDMSSFVNGQNITVDDGFTL